MNYLEHKPSPSLAEQLECFWFASTEDEPASVTPERVLPDGCIEWIFHLGAPFRRLNCADEWQLQPRSFVVGELTRFILLQPTGRVATMGVRFRPGGAYRFLPFPLNELTDGFASTSDVWGPAGEYLEDEVLNVRTNTQRQHAVETFLHRRLTQTESRPRFDAAVREVLRTHGRTRVNQLAETIGWTPRHLEREFRSGAGLSPKAIARIVRFQNLLRQVGDGRLREWATVALDCGYADQSHMVREFGELAGQSPSRSFASPLGELSSYFITPQRLAVLLGD